MIYGCDVAQTDAGRALIDSLARLTGADVAASTDLTGSALLGGDWDLEYANGDIETAVAFGADVQQNWFGILPTAAITARETVDSDGNGQIDHIKMTAEGALNDDFSDINVTVSGYTLAATPYVTSIGAGGALDDVFYVALLESGSADTDATPTITITANSNLATVVPTRAIATDAGVAATDKAGPVALTHETADLDSDGFIDAIHITFSEAVDDSSIVANDWDVAGVTGEAFSSTTNGDTADDADIYITFTDGVLDTGATPLVSYVQDDPTDADIAGLDGNLVADVNPDWWDDDWLNRRQITFNNTNSAESLTDFPVLVRLDPSNIDFDKIKAGGADIRFVDDDGTLLSYEIESWDDTPTTTPPPPMRRMRPGCGMPISWARTTWKRASPTRRAAQSITTPPRTATTAPRAETTMPRARSPAGSILMG